MTDNTEILQQTPALSIDDVAKSIKKHPKKIADIESVERYVPDAAHGLNDYQLNKRLTEGLINLDTSKNGKSYARIILGNIFTFFNMLYLAIATVLLIYGQFKNVLFLLIIVANTAVAIIQEIKSKKMLDKLNIVTVPHVKAVRNGKEYDIATTGIVLDDIIKLETGNQISCDAIVLEGSIEVNESILTGESEAVTKKAGDTLYAGSFIVSGKCVARVDKVGKYNYISGLTGRARQYKKPRSQMLRSLKAILIFVAVIVLPMAFGLWEVNTAVYSNPQYWGGVLPDQRNVFITVLNKTSGSIISMIPAGPFLLTTMALAVSLIRLAKRKTMVQELYCIEMLARVNCLCLDKTGTITDGTMSVVDCVDMRVGKSRYTVRELMSAFNKAVKDNNLTGKALKKYFGSPDTSALKPLAVLPFSSQRKLSAVSFENEGTYILGAPEFVLRAENPIVNEIVEKYAKQGLRVLLMAHSPTIMYNTDKLPTFRRPVAVIVIEDHIRSEAADTIKWFVENNVDVKVISGDNAMTVSNIALRVGIKNADKFVSLEGMTDDEVIKAATEYSVFGRVSPDQKALLVKTLRASGNTVAMTGDGVNDILALKESDCSIALAGGSDAARKVSHLVLLEDNFAMLPQVVAEGRRVVNNIQSATSMYFMKTLYIIFINVLLIMLHYIWHISSPTPYESIQIMLLETVIVGLPTTLLALQPNRSIIKGKFMPNVLRRCLPASIVFIISTVSIYVVRYSFMPEMTADELSTLIAITYTYGGLFALFYACRPFNVWKTAMYISIAVVSTLAIILFPEFWSYAPLSREQLLMLLVEILALPYLLMACMKLFELTSRFKPKFVKKFPFIVDRNKNKQNKDSKTTK